MSCAIYLIPSKANSTAVYDAKYLFPPCPVVDNQAPICCRKTLVVINFKSYSTVNEYKLYMQRLMDIAESLFHI